MTKEVKITIDGRQLGAEEDRITVTAFGKYHCLKSKHYIHYEEKNETGEGITKNTIKISSDIIDITKVSDKTTQMVFNIHAATQTCYQTPYGNLLLQIRTTELKVEESPDEILVKLQYTLSTNDSHLSDNKTMIRVCSERK